MLDHHRAFLDAGAAGGAGPQRVRVDHRPGADDGQFRPADAGDGPGVRIGAAGVSRVGGARLEAGGEVLDQPLRVERLAGGEGRAGDLAAPALDAGVEADQPVEGEVGRRCRAEAGASRSRGRSAVARSPSKRPGRGWATRCAAPAKAWRIGPWSIWQHEPEAARRRQPQAKPGERPDRRRRARRRGRRGRRRARSRRGRRAGAGSGRRRAAAASPGCAAARP